MDSLSSLEKHLNILLEQHLELQEQLRLLKEENVRQRDEILQSHTELQLLKKEYARLQTAHAMVANDDQNEEERLKAKQKLTSIISQIDKALEVLKH